MKMRVALTGKTLKKLHTYPKLWGGQPMTVFSNSYITNGFIVINTQCVKNMSDICKNNNGKDWFFHKESVLKISSLGENELVQQTDIDIEAFIPSMVSRPTAVKKSGLLLITDTTLVSIYYSDAGELVFFDYNLLDYYKIEFDKFYGFDTTSVFTDTQNDSFNIAIMPIKAEDLSNVLTAEQKMMLKNFVKLITE